MRQPRARCEISVTFHCSHRRRDNEQKDSVEPDLHQRGSHHLAGVDDDSKGSTKWIPSCSYSVAVDGCTSTNCTTAGNAEHATLFLVASCKLVCHRRTDATGADEQ
jgi:hypothetical protein